MHERRKHPRKKVAQPLKLTDLARDSILGHLIDLSLDGLMLLVREQLPVNRVFQLSLELPAEMHPDTSATFGAESVWREISGDPSHFWVGMQIIDISPEESAKLNRFIEEYL